MKEDAGYSPQESPLPLGGDGPGVLPNGSGSNSSSFSANKEMKGSNKWGLHSSGQK